MTSRARDILIAAPALCVLAPWLLLAALLVLLFDGRPVFFRQLRSGLHGRQFSVIKFRTMAEARDESGALLPDSQRITALGKWLRATRFDEIPQLWNILVGQMSLVGPRPLLPATIKAAGISGQRRGHVRPGLTGWAQVNGNRLLSDADKIALDNWYVEHRSGALDLNIVCRTITVLLRGERVDHAAIGRANASGHHRGS